MSIRSAVQFEKYLQMKSNRNLNLALSIHYSIRYYKNVQRLSKMMRAKAQTPLDRVVRHAEFAAEFGELPQLDPFGRQMGYIQYFLIDIFVPIILLFVFVACVIVRIIQLAVVILFDKIKKH